MSTLFGGDIYAGLSGIELEGECFDLGEGVVLRKTYAHLMTPFIVAFTPAPPGKHHPGPWKSASGGLDFNVNAELVIPSHIEEKFDSKIGIARILIFLFRLGVNPAITLPVFSSHAFSSIPQNPDCQPILHPFEIQPRHFPLGVVGRKVNADGVEWVKDRWQIVHRLTSESPEFSLAVDAIDTGQFVTNTALTMVSLWGALESLFSPATSELKFRVSSLIASYLKGPGVERAKLQKDVARLYDKRSAAAHGKPKHKEDDLLATFTLLRNVLMEIIDQEKVPSKDDLEKMLFGVTQAERS